jgi:haloalkane dehalogenase
LILRTPDDRFENLQGFDFSPHYLEINDHDLGALRVHYLDEGPKDGPVILCMHGNPSWCYLYRKMIPILAAAGFRVLAPDLIGFGRSDQPARAEDYSYAKHISWMSDWLISLNVSNVTLVAQDWGGLIGLRLVTAMPDLFSAMSLSNTGMPTGDQPMPEAFLKWRAFCSGPAEFDPGLIVNEFGRGTLTNAEMDAYRAPFPDQSYLVHVKAFAKLVPASPDNAETENNRSAWKQLMQWQKPVLLCFSNGDPITAGGDKVFMKLVPGTAGQPHITLDGGHFIQETQGGQWAHAIVDWLNK